MDLLLIPPVPLDSDPIISSLDHLISLLAGPYAFRLAPLADNLPLKRPF